MIDVSRRQMKLIEKSTENLNQNVQSAVAHKSQTRMKKYSVIHDGCRPQIRPTETRAHKYKFDNDIHMCVCE